MSRGIPIKVIPRRIYGVYVVGFADYVKIGCSANAIGLGTFWKRALCMDREAG